MAGAPSLQILGCRQREAQTHRDVRLKIVRSWCLKQVPEGLLESRSDTFCECKPAGTDVAVCKHELRPHTAVLCWVSGSYSASQSFSETSSPPSARVQDGQPAL